MITVVSLPEIRKPSAYRALFFAVCLIAVAPAFAHTTQTGRVAEDQDEQSQQQLRPIEARPTQAGRVADSSVGKVGQRQSREQAAEGIAPTGRIANRIQNRVQSRIRNRVDRNYDSQANAIAPFTAAEDQVRSVRPNR